VAGDLGRDEARASEYFFEDLKFAATNFFEATFAAAGLDLEKPDVARYINGLADIAAESMAREMNSVIEDAKRAEEQAVQQFAAYAGLDPEGFFVVQLPSGTDEEDGTFTEVDESVDADDEA
jgi:hypothetical protein